MGMQPGGPFTSDQGGDKFGYDVFDRTRLMAMGRPPGTGPATIAPNVVGHITVSAYRAHEKMTLLESRIFRTRPLGGQWGSVDTRGQQYVSKQEEYMSQRFRNNREFMVSRMLRGKFDVKIVGDNWVAVETGSGHFSVDFKVPAGNKSQLDMLGAGSIIDVSWANNAANIPLHLLKINAAFEQLHGLPLRHVWINSTGLNNVMNNLYMQNIAGTANRVFESFLPTGIQGPDGIEDTGFTVRFNAVPWITWHVYDGGLDISTTGIDTSGTFTKFIGDTQAIFLPDPSSTIWEWYNGSEIVKENVMAPGEERFGLQAWTTGVIDPAGFEMKAVDVGMCVPYIPKAIAFGTVVF